MLSNLPPGVSEHDLPGSRPEDQEVELTIVLSKGEIDDLRRFNDEQNELDVLKQ